LVITLNYDTLVESAVMSLELGDTSVGKVLPPLTYANPLRPAESEWGASMNPYARRQATLTLCKLHGSLSWWRSGPVHQAPVDVGTWTDRFNAHKRATWEEVAGRVMTGEPMLVPPTLAKSDYFDNDVVRANWRRAYEGLRSASTVVVMGYSLPNGDTQTAALLGSATADGDRRVVVVDLNGDVVDRVRTCCHSARIDVAHFSDSDRPIAEWAEQWASNPNVVPGVR
jgi:hypothetical protein